jgi:hypothetical protein
MSRKTMVRTITATTINSSNVKFEKNAPVVTANEPITITGIVDEDKALKAVRKAYGQTAQVASIVQVDDVYEMSVADFMKYAKKVDPTQVQAIKQETK